MPLPLLPTEVIENVIDQATRNTNTLRSFASTCRDLLPRSRYHLFYSIRFQDTDQLYSFYGFLDLYPHVGSFVVSLKLSIIRGNPKSTSLLQIIPTVLFRKLPNLRTWVVTNPSGNLKDSKQHQWLSFYSPMLRCLKVFVATIVKLRLSHVSLPNCAQFVEYIMAFRGIKHLYYADVHFKADLDGARLHWIKERLTAQLQLSAMRIGPDVPDDAALVLLESCSSTLRHLQLYVSKSTKLDIPAIVSELHELRSLTLDLPVYKRSSRENDIEVDRVLRAFQIIKALGLRPGSHLQTLIIRLRPFTPASFLHTLSKKDSFSGLECFSELETILLRLPSLRNIEVQHDAKRNINLTFMLEEYLPTLTRERSVTFKSSTPHHLRQANHDGWTRAIAISLDSKRIASGSDDRTIILWDTERRSIVREWIAHSDRVSSLAFSPDSRRLASAGDDRKVVVWAIGGSRVKRVAILEGHSDKVRTCAWSPDGTTLASGSDDRTVRVWDARTYQQLHSLQDPSDCSVQFVQFSLDGRWIASGGWSTLCAVWDATGGNLRKVELRGHNDSLQNGAFDIVTGRIATASYNGTIRIWDVETGDTLVILKGHTGWVRDVGFSPDGRHVVSGSDDKTVKVWDSSSGKPLLSLGGHTRPVSMVRFSPDGRYVASASLDKTVRLWRASDGVCIRTFTEHTGDVECLVYSPDGEILTSGGEDGKVCIRRLCDVIPDGSKLEANGLA